MFVREEYIQSLWDVRSKTGNMFKKKRTKTVYVLRCDGCKREYTRERGKTGIKITLQVHHFCELCDQRSLSGKVAKTVRTNQCRLRVGERRIGRDGYPEVYVGPDYVHARPSRYGGYYWADEHTVVMQEQLGRRLADEEVVHHIDGDKTNNALSNLVVLTKEEHNRCHGHAEQLVFQLVKQGQVAFDKTTKRYVFRV